MITNPYALLEKQETDLSSSDNSSSEEEEEDPDKVKDLT